jgi:class 3 adenylate cyclase
MIACPSCGFFCDLVGFTAMSEAADPEDVDAVLRGG